MLSNRLINLSINYFQSSKSVDNSQLAYHDDSRIVIGRLYSIFFVELWFYV